MKTSRTNFFESWSLNGLSTFFFLFTWLLCFQSFAKTVPCLEPTTKKDPDVTWKEQGFEVKELPCYQLTREGLERQVAQKKEVEFLRALFFKCKKTSKAHG